MSLDKNMITRRQSGFTLLEAMIALLIFSVGLLGLAGMQMAGLQNNQDAMLRTLAYQQLYDMTERIRGNWSGYSAGNYDNLVGISSRVNCNPCSVAQQASNDYAEWSTNSAAILPEGTVSTTRQGVSNLLLSIQWTDRVSGDTVTTSLSFVP